MRVFSMSVAVLCWCQPSLGCTLFPDAPPAAQAEAGAKLRKVRTGFGFLEGPACDGLGNLYFVDMSTSSLYRLDTQTDAVDLILEKTETGAGLMFDQSGRLFMTQFGGSKLVEVDLATRSMVPVVEGFEGKPLCSVNDLSIDATGGIYFTDPLYRQPPHPQGMQSVYYASAEKDGKRTITRVLPDDQQPNGVLLSPDGATLYAVPAGRPALVACSVKAPGVIGDKREVTLPGNGDGLAVDAAGNIYIALPGKKSIQMVKPDLTLGEHWEIPEGPANCEFAGKDLSTLYITARSSLYALDLGVKGHRVTQVPPRGAQRPPAAAASFSDLSDVELRDVLVHHGASLIFSAGPAADNPSGAAGKEGEGSLTPQGIEDMKAIGAALKSLEVEITDARTASSKPCRLAADAICSRSVPVDAGLDGRSPESLAAFLSAPVHGVTVVIATPQALLPHLPPRVRAMGEGTCMVMKRQPNGKATCVAYLTLADWKRISASK